MVDGRDLEAFRRMQAEDPVLRTLMEWVGEQPPRPQCRHADPAGEEDCDQVCLALFGEAYHTQTVALPMLGVPPEDWPTAPGETEVEILMHWAHPTEHVPACMVAGTWEIRKTECHASDDAAKVTCPQCKTIVEEAVLAEAGVSLEADAWKHIGDMLQESMKNPIVYDTTPRYLCRVHGNSPCSSRCNGKA